MMTQTEFPPPKKKSCMKPCILHSQQDQFANSAKQAFFSCSISMIRQKTDRESDSDTDRQTYRQTDRQTESD